MKKDFKINGIVFYPSVIILLGLIFYGFFQTDSFVSMMTAAFNWVTDTGGWFMLIAAFLVLLLCFIVCLTPIGDKKVGGPDAKIQHSMFTWVAMVTCAGTATAVVFYAVAEPIGYFHNPPAWWTGFEPETMDTAVRAVSQSAFHWSFIYYAMYAFWGFIAGYMIMNHHLPVRPSSALYPLLKDKIYGPIGKVFDILSLLGLVGGMVTSLGLGVQQFAAGLKYVFGMEPSNLMYAITLIVVIATFTISSIIGVKRGMAVISNINAYIYLFVIAFLLIAGPTLFQCKLFTQVCGDLLDRYIPAVTAADSFDVADKWVNNNTVFYFAWVMTYGPVMGVFQGRVGQGYTWRRFLLVNVLGPGVFNLVWFTVFGGNAIYVDHFRGGTIGAEIAEGGAPIANYALLNYLPFKGLMIPLVVAALFFGFVTLADALTGTLSKISIVKEGNDEAEEAPSLMKFIWGTLVGVMTFLCLFSLGTGGTSALQFMSVIIGLPIFIVTFLVFFSLPKLCSLKIDKEFEEMTPEEREAIEQGRPLSTVKNRSAATTKKSDKSE